MKVYIAYVCGFAAIREMGTDKLLYQLEGKRSIEEHFSNGHKYSEKMGWTVV
jgi:hypothetical protein